MKSKLELVLPHPWLTFATLLASAARLPAQPSTNAAAASATNPPPAAAQAAFTFGLDGLAVLQHRLGGIPLWQYVAMLLYLLLAFACAKLLDYLIGVRLKKWAARTETKWDDLAVALLHGPVKVVTFVILLHVSFKVFPWPAWLANYLSKGMVILVACSLTYVALKSVDALLAYWKQKAAARGGEKALDEQIFPVVRISLQVFVIVVAILLTSQNMGLHITSLLASLSIGGLALGLAAQDTLANLFGAVSVFMDKPFLIGDRIKLDSVDGTVESIGLRSTRVRNLDGHLVTIPNKTMGNATITNVTRRPHIKTDINFGLTYDTSLEKLQHALAILTEVYRSHPMTTEVVVSFNKFGDSALNILVAHCWGGLDQKAYLAGMQELNLKIKERFEREGIQFAFPSQTHYVKQIQ